MAHFFAPVANVVLGSVRPEEEGQASGANNALRELGGVFGVAVLASIFSSYGGYGSGQLFVDGMRPALWIGVAVLAAASLVAYAVPNTRRRTGPLVAAADSRRDIRTDRAATPQRVRLDDGHVVAVRPKEAVTPFILSRQHDGAGRAELAGH